MLTVTCGGNLVLHLVLHGNKEMANHSNWLLDGPQSGLDSFNNCGLMPLNDDMSAELRAFVVFGSIVARLGYIFPTRI